MDLIDEGIELVLAGVVLPAPILAMAPSSFDVWALPSLPVNVRNVFFISVTRFSIGVLLLLPALPYPQNNLAIALAGRTDINLLVVSQVTQG